jgi:hypothetical protein
MPICFNRGNTGASTTTHCPVGSTCAGGAAPAVTCSAGAGVCGSGSFWVKLCGTGASIATPCAAGSTCAGGTAGEVVCPAGNYTRMTCARNLPDKSITWARHGATDNWGPSINAGDRTRRTEAECQALCEDNAACKGWSYRYSTLGDSNQQGNFELCWLLDADHVSYGATGSEGHIHSSICAPIEETCPPGFTCAGGAAAPVAHTVCDAASTVTSAGDAITDTTCACAPGFHTLSSDGTFCTTCSAGYTCAGGAAAPAACPPGFTCAGGAAAPVAHTVCDAASTVVTNVGDTLTDTTCACKSIAFLNNDNAGSCDHTCDASGTTTITTDWDFTVASSSDGEGEHIIIDGDTTLTIDGDVAFVIAAC